MLSNCGMEKTPLNYSESKLNYHFDTIFKTYKGDFTKQYVGGIDLHFKDSTTYVVYNYCGSNQLKIIDFASDSVLELPFYNPDFKKIYSEIKKRDIYVLAVDGKIFQYCNSKLDHEIVFDLMKDSIFKNSGLLPANYKAGGDQHIRIPENVIYFTLEPDYENANGKYSKMNYGYPKFGKFNFTDNTLQFFDKEPHFVPYQDYGLVSNRYSLFIGDSIITSDGTNGLIRIINTKNNTTQTVEAKSKYDIYPLKKWRYHKGMKDAHNKKMQHWIESSGYESLFYNPFTKKYYRIFHPKMDKLNSDGLNNTMEDKPCVLMVFDEKFKLIDEVLLPIKRLNVIKLFPIKDGVSIYLPELFKIDTNQIKKGFLNIHHN